MCCQTSESGHKAQENTTQGTLQVVIWVLGGSCWMIIECCICYQGFLPDTAKPNHIQLMSHRCTKCWIISPNISVILPLLTCLGNSTSTFGNFCLHTMCLISSASFFLIGRSVSPRFSHFFVLAHFSRPLGDIPFSPAPCSIVFKSPSDNEMTFPRRIP